MAKSYLIFSTLAEFVMHVEELGLISVMSSFPDEDVIFVVGISLLFQR